MPPGNLERMIQLADQFFDARNDSDQLSVDETVINTLREIHPASVTERRNEDGPIGWFIVIPTTCEVMNRFINKSINERAILDLTPRSGEYDALYLCSALILPEHRGKGIASKAVTDAISAIRSTHPISHLFYWAWSPAGEHLATSIASEFGLPLHKRPE